LSKTARLPTVLLAITLVAVATALAGCGGGDAQNAFDAVETDTVGGTTDEVETTTSSGSSEPASVDPGAVPPPGAARIEVDGEVYTLEASGSIHYTCEVTDDEIRVNYQQTESGDLSIQASTITGEWGGNVTFAKGDDNYGGSFRGTDGLALGDGALTYTGTLTHRTYSDPSTTRDVEATIAVNCGASGAGGAEEATAEIGGRTLVFPASGAQSFECEVSPTSVTVRVNRLALEDAQIEIQATQQSGGDWLGNVYVISGSDRYNAIIPADGTGLDITGTTVMFQGTFTQTSESDPSAEQEVTGSASVTCS
jgi:hypothetical protein